jgi:hypothetical protein
VGVSFDEEVAVRCLLVLDVGGASLRRLAGGVVCELLDSGAIVAVAVICGIEEPSPAEQILGIVYFLRCHNVEVRAVVDAKTAMLQHHRSGLETACGRWQ